MKVIGITIESSRTIFYTLQKTEDGIVTKLAEEYKSISIADDLVSAELRTFQEKVYALFDNIKPDRIAILKRMTKGKFAAGSASFKLEGIMQCYANVEIEFVAPATIKAFYKKNEFNQTPAHKYQINAAQLAQFLVS